MKAVNVPSSMIAGAAKASLAGEDAWEGAKAQATLTGPQVGWRDVLEQQNILSDNPKLRSAAGFIGDVALDPLNLVSLPTKALATGIKAIPGVKAAATAIGKTGLAQDLGKKFIPHFEAPSYMRDDLGLLQMRQSGGFNTAKQELEKLLKDVPEHLRLQIPDALEGAHGPFNPQLQKAVDDIKGWRDARFAREEAAGTIDPAHKVDNYMTYLFPRNKQLRKDAYAAGVSAKSRFSMPRNIKDWQSAVAAGVEADPLIALGARGGVGEKAAVTADWVSEMASKYGTPTVSPGFKTVKVSGIVENSALGQKLKGTYFPEEVADSLTRVFKLNIEERGALATMFDNVMRVWRPLATSVNPAFHARNAISNAWLMSASGMSPADVVSATARGLAGRSGKGIHPTILDQARKYDILGGTHFGELDNLGRGRTIETLPVFKQGRQVGNAVEESARLGMFDHYMRKGFTADEAALKVRKYLFNYSELTDFEKGVRRTVMPFYTWLRKAGPVVAESFIENPKLWSRTQKGIDLMANLAKDTGSFVEDASVPEYMRDQIQLPAGEGGARFMTNPFPVTEVEKWVHPLQTLGQGLNPLLKLPIEAYTKKSLFNQRDLTPSRGPGVETSWSDLKPSNSLVGDVVGKLQGLGKNRADKRYTPAWADWLGGNIPSADKAYGAITGVAATAQDNPDITAAPGILERAIGLTKQLSPEDVARLDLQQRRNALTNRRADLSRARLERLARMLGEKEDE
jgi:hypothetical protein